MFVGGISDIYIMIEDKLSFMEFIDAINHVKQQYFGLIDDRTAALLVLKQNNIEMLPLRLIGSISTEMCSIVCKVIWSSEIKNFKRPHSDSEGKVMRIVVEDLSSRCRITIWSTRIIELFEKNIICVGDYVYIHKVKPKGKSQGKFEIEFRDDYKDTMAHEPHSELVLGSGAVVRVISEEEYKRAMNMLLALEEKDYISKRNLIESIEDIYNIDSDKIKIGTLTADVSGIVQDIIPMRILHKYGREIRIAKLKIFDGTGTIWAILWDSASEIADDIQIGTEVSLTGAKVKIGLNDAREVHVSKKSQIRIFKVQS